MTTADTFDAEYGDPVFQTTFQAFAEGDDGNGILDAGDLEVTAGSNSNALDVAATTRGLWYDGSLHTYAGGTNVISLSANSSGSDRWDLIYFDTSDDTPKAREGTAATKPDLPKLQSGEFPLAAVYVADGQSDVTDSEIKNYRVHGSEAAESYLDDSPSVYAGDTVESALTSELQYAAQLSGYPVPIGDLSTPYGLDELTDMDVDGTDLTDAATVLYESSNGWFRNEVVQALANLTGDEQFSAYPLALTDLDSPFSLPSITDMDAGGNDLVDGATTIWDTSAGEIPRTSLDDEYRSASVSSNTTTSGEEVIYADASGGAITITLASADARTGKQVIVMDDTGDAGTNSITIDTEGSETIEGASSTSISDNWGAIVLQSNGTNWRIVAEISGTLTDTRTDVSDDGTTVVSETEDINFSTNLSVSDDGDGTVTVSASGSSDTRTDVSDDGSTVVSETEDINFGTDAGVSDDGDGSVTVDISSTLDSVRGRGNSITGQLADLGTNPGAFGALLDMVVDGNSTAGTAHSYLFAIDGTTLLRFYAESDGSGGLQNVELRALSVFAVGDDIVTTGGTTVWDSSAGEIPQAQLGGPAASLSSYPLPIGDLNTPYGLDELTDMDVDGTDLVDGATTVWDTSAGHVPRGSVDDARTTATVTSSTHTTSGEEVVLVDTSTIGGASTITLASADAVSGKTVVVLDLSGAASSNNITVDTESTETIDGGSSATISTDYGVRTYRSDGSNWVEESGTGGTTDTRTDVSDGGSTVVSDTEDINFASNLSVTDDGDGSVTVDASGSSDTTTDVSDDGTTVVSQTTDINFGDFANVTDDGDGTVTVDFEKAKWAADSPESFQVVLLEDTESTEKVIPVNDGETLTVFRWGVYRLSDQTAPTGLEVQLLNDSDTVDTSASTTDNENLSSGVASLSNSSGSLSFYKIRLNNGTGSDLVTDGVGGHVGYVVE